LDIGPDGNWTDEGFEARYVADLSNGIGNFLNRTLTMLHMYRKGIVPEISRELEAEVKTRVDQVETLLRQHRLQDGLVVIRELVRFGDQYIQTNEPFKLAKDPAKTVRLDEILYNLTELCRIVAVMYAPFLPATAERIYAQLKVCGELDHWSETRWGGLEPGHEVGPREPMFPKRDKKAPKG
jgi:methionyl-tRNA synthetase